MEDEDPGAFAAVFGEIDSKLVVVYRVILRAIEPEGFDRNDFNEMAEFFVDHTSRLSRQYITQIIVQGTSDRLAHCAQGEVRQHKANDRERAEQRSRADLRHDVEDHV
jgi:hypothetical protein